MTQPAVPSSENGIDDLPERLHGFALMHVAMRRDARRAVVRAHTLVPTDARPVVAWWRRFQALVEHHHRSEDEVFWPALAAAVPGFTSAHALSADHEALDAAAAEVADALVSGGDQGARARSVGAAERFEALLRDHLRREEAAVLPALAEMPPAQYEAIEGRLTRTAPFAVLSMLQPWMFDGASPAAVRRVSASIPAPARLLGRTVWRRQYDRLVAPVRRPG